MEKDNQIDWINKLNEYGYCVIPNILSKNECDDTIGKIWDWLESLETGINRNDKNTWAPPNWPPSIHGIIQNLRVGHEQFVWNVRTNKNVINVFRKIWKSDDLLVSFDGINITKPMEITKYRNTNQWFHIDQSNRKKGRHCIQSLVNLEESTEEDVCFSCFPNSHLFHEEMTKKFKIDTDVDWIKLSRDQLKWYEIEKKCFRKRIHVPKGAMLLWDSRTVHCNRHAIKKRLNPYFRYTIYICMTPRHFSNQDNLEKRKNAYNKMRMTTHWPHDIRLYPERPKTYDKIIPNFKIRSELPILNNIGMKLIGF